MRVQLNDVIPLEGELGSQSKDLLFLIFLDGSLISISFDFTSMSITSSLIINDVSRSNKALIWSVLQLYLFSLSPDISRIVRSGIFFFIRLLLVSAFMSVYIPWKQKRYRRVIIVRKSTIGTQHPENKTVKNMYQALFSIIEWYLKYELYIMLPKLCRKFRITRVSVHATINLLKPENFISLS